MQYQEAKVSSKTAKKTSTNLEPPLQNENPASPTISVSDIEMANNNGA